MVKSECDNQLRSNLYVASFGLNRVSRVERKKLPITSALIRHSEPPAEYPRVCSRWDVCFIFLEVVCASGDTCGNTSRAHSPKPPSNIRDWRETLEIDVVRPVDLYGAGTYMELVVLLHRGIYTCEQPTSNFARLCCLSCFSTSSSTSMISFSHEQRGLMRPAR